MVTDDGVMHGVHHISTESIEQAYMAQRRAMSHVAAACAMEFGQHGDKDHLSAGAMQRQLVPLEICLLCKEQYLKHIQGRMATQGC